MGVPRSCEGEDGTHLFKALDLTPRRRWPWAVLDSSLTRFASWEARGLHGPLPRPRGHWGLALLGISQPSGAVAGRGAPGGQTGAAAAARAGQGQRARAAPSPGWAWGAGPGREGQLSAGLVPSRARPARPPTPARLASEPIKHGACGHQGPPGPRAAERRGGARAMRRARPPQPLASRRRGARGRERRGGCAP